MRFYLLAILTLLCLSSSGQKIDSLLNKSHQVNGIEKLNLLNDACRHAFYYEKHKSDSLTTLLQKEAQSQNNKYYLGQSYYFKGLAAQNSSLFEAAFESFSNALDFFKELDSAKQVAAIHHNLSLVHYSLGNKHEAQVSLEAAMTINEKIGNSKNLINNKLVLVGRSTDNEKSIGIYKEILALSKEIDYHGGVMVAYINMNVINSSLGRLDTALYCLVEAEKYLKYPSTQIYKSYILSSKASLYFKMEDYANAELYYTKLIDEIEDKEKKGNTEEKSLKINTYYNLAETKSKLGEYKSAAYFYKKYADQSDSLGLVEQARAVASAEAKYKLEIKDKENALLKKEAEISDELLSTSKKQRILLGLLLVSAIAAIILLTLRYVTKQKHYKEIEASKTQIEEQNERLNLMNIEMEGILQVVSHDFRTPLAKIKMLNELLENQESEKLSDKGKEKISRIHKSIGEAENLVSDILEIRAIYNSENTTDEPEAFDMLNCINEVVEDYKIPIELKNLEVNTSMEGESIVITELYTFKRILGNLLSNAVKFSANDTKINILAKHSEGRIELTVQDNGPGFSEKDKEDVFVKPGKLSNKPDGWGTSHGLGLYIIDKLVREKLGGSISLKSETGKGATFNVSWNSMIG